MKKYQCLIVDDEPLARRVIEKYCLEFEELQIIAQCGNAFEAAKYLQAETIDILFLDINMPKLSGINFLKLLQNPPLVILTTAYTEYAIEGFELDVVDYLLKPISLERFTKAVLKAFKLLQPVIATPKSILIKADKRLHKVNFSEVIYLEAYGDYVKVILKTGQLLPKKKLSDLLKELPKTQFLQIHRSFIVNVEHIQYLEGNFLKIHKQQLPISQTYKPILLKRLGK